MEKGYLSIVLHAHLPFIRHPEYKEFLEESWLFEAITETYIPLLKVFEGLANDGVKYRVTMSVTPTLGAMLRDELLQERYLKHITRLALLASAHHMGFNLDFYHYSLSRLSREARKPPGIFNGQHYAPSLLWAKETGWRTAISQD